MRVNRAGVLMMGAMMTAVLAGTPPVAAADAVVPTAIATRRVIISIPDRKLAVVDDTGVLEVFDVAVGKPSTPSPVGTFTIVNRVTHPTYYSPGKVIPAGPRNPLGTRWMGLSKKSYGIHGTSDPGSIGFAKSTGCIRMRNSDVERLFERLRPGDVVELHAERTSETAKLFPIAN